MLLVDCSTSNRFKGLCWTWTFSQCEIWSWNEQHSSSRLVYQYIKTFVEYILNNSGL